jgi:XTP/dITP diphosphohydrolase
VTGADPSAALAAVEDLVAVMDRLRSPGGCPWDAAQTHASLLPYAVEEVYEVVEAVENDDRTALCEELGDLLLQVVFHARVAQEHPREPFGLAEVAAGVAAKLRHRHPHVFGDAVVRDAEDVHRRWEEIKAAEKARASVLDGIPAGLPALARAQKVLGRARRAGLSVDDAQSMPSASEATGGTAVAGNRDPGEASGLGRVLLEIAVAAEAAGVDAEAALRAAVRELEAALRRAEAADGAD